MIIEQKIHPGFCLHVPNDGDDDVVMKSDCTTLWKYTSEQIIVHVKSGKCLYTPTVSDTLRLSSKCDEDYSKYKHDESNILRHNVTLWCVHIAGGGLTVVQNAHLKLESQCLTDTDGIKFNFKAGNKTCQCRNIKCGFSIAFVRQHIKHNIVNEIS